MPALNESEYYRNLGVEVKPIGANGYTKPVGTQIANDLLGDLGGCAWCAGHSRPTPSLIFQGPVPVSRV